MASNGERVSERARGRLQTLAYLKEGMAKSFDGTKLYYRSVGKGEPPVIFCSGLGVEAPFWTYQERHFKLLNQTICWDYRGHGRSELKRDPENYTIAALVRDCKAVLDALKIKKAVFVGHSMGVQVIFEFYRKHPERVAGLVPAFGTYAHPMDHFFNLKYARYLFDLWYIIGTTFPRQSKMLGQLLLTNPFSFWIGGLLNFMHIGMVRRSDIDRYTKHLFTVDPDFFTRLLKDAQEQSSEDMLKDIKVPTLIVAGGLDQITPLWISKKMHRLIRGSEIFIMHKATHAGLLEQPDLINLRIEKFIQSRIRHRRGGRQPGTAA